ncbi:Hypothetical predicted protein [Olea europaea subsp. europaea]|uniref:Uncharacterized protein n=1 Tax=Olea europaea subsp. europaea TaxID=158383 RepID=A0A8S0QEI8_OLEEU|nr:Hypothetical predicted protein [Olea europaea subsp. europaea]
MYRQSPSRTHRSKGIKIKHVLQICLLLAVCFWLIYQVKHSHDKKKEFDESDSIASLSRASSNKILTLGRKDIRPRVEETVKNEKHDEAAIEQESIEEVEDDKREEHEQEIKKAEQREDEGMEGEDDEMNEHEHEKSDAEIDREEEFIEEKEGDEGDENSTEEKDTEETNGETEKEGSIEDNNHDGDEHSAHEAREEHYKADDASSAVAHDNQIIDPENEKGSLENTKEQWENKENGEEINLDDKRTDLEMRDGNMTKSDDHSNVTTNIEWKNKEKGEEVNLGVNRTNLEVKDGSMSKSDNQSNVTTNEAEEKLKEKSENSSLSNATLTVVSNDHIETSNISLGMRMESRDPSLQNGTESKLVLNHGENGTIGGTTSGVANNSTSDMVSNHVDSISTIPPKNKDLESSSWEFADSSNDSESSVAENIRSELSVEAGNNTESLTVKNDATEAEKSDNDVGTDEFSDKTSEDVQHDPIDSSDSSNSLDKKDVLTNHETLPEIQSAGTSIEDAAAE